MIRIERRRSRKGVSRTARFSSESRAAQTAERAAMPRITSEASSLIAVVGLLVAARILQRFRIPAHLTSVAFGVAVAVILAPFSQDAAPAPPVMSGIAPLFLFAGLKVDVHAVWLGMVPRIGHLVVRSVSARHRRMDPHASLRLRWQVTRLLTLSLLTPSTGFIVDTLGRSGLTEGERFWVTIKAISGARLPHAAASTALPSFVVPTLIDFGLAVPHGSPRQAHAAADQAPRA
jgi:hypothetical protein